MNDKPAIAVRRNPPARSYYEQSRDRFARFMWGSDKPAAQRDQGDDFDDCC